MGLDMTTGKVAVGGDGNSPASFTMRSDSARFLFHAPRRGCRTGPRVSRATARDASQSFSRIFKGHEERIGTKELGVTYRSVDSLRKKLAENPQDLDAY
ncbi:hypothetical protein H4582DRAFT_2079598 [Lactarius indigo]|nr:hypothetical protein H4582DRAFT_2079598 [Lactarius indigo]